jgi:hypothetical protein
MREQEDDERTERFSDRTTLVVRPPVSHSIHSIPSGQQKIMAVETDARTD